MIALMITNCGHGENENEYDNVIAKIEAHPPGEQLEENIDQNICDNKHKIRTQLWRAYIYVSICLQLQLSW